MTKKIREFLYSNRDILLVVVIIIIVKAWDWISEAFKGWWFVIVPAALLLLFLIRKRLKKFVRYLVFDVGPTLVTAGIIAFLIISFVVQAFKIPTGSMKPTLLEGDFILVNKFLYGAKVPFTDLRLPKVREPKRGDIVVFIYPEDRKKDFIKRLVGLPGDTVEIRKGTIYINDAPLLDPLFNQRYYYNYGELAAEGSKIAVPADSYFVLGDNSSSSKDSRYWGFVPHKNMLGKAILIWWPPNRAGAVK